jgi:MoaA/NifB/PqqE/SkfB family radical SAM enzyme
VLHEGREVASIDLPRRVQIEPVGRRLLPRRLSAISMRVDGLRGGPPGFLSVDAFAKLLAQLPGLEALRLQGDGEPLAHPRFFDMVSHAAARGVAVSTTTRLQVFNRRLAEDCVKSGLRTLHVALDAAGTREYDFSRAGPRHERLLRHLRWLCDARKAHKRGLPRIVLDAVLLRRNAGALADVVRLAHAHGADAVAPQYLGEFVEESGVPASHRRVRKFLESEALGPGDDAMLEEAFAKAKALAHELGVALELPAARERAGCPWPWQSPYISFSGEARSCNLASRSTGAGFGNMLKEGVAQVWQGEAYRQFRERHAAGDPPPPCADCPRARPA